jgi:ADP-glucose pyrophosphorylase
MGELNVRTINIDDSLGQHIESTQNWQRYTGERIHNLERQHQQSQEEWRAYYRWAGFNPNQPQ